MIHILFGQSQSGTLNAVLKNSGVQHEERIISLWDIFSVGPIRQLQKENGITERFAWLEQHMNDYYNEFPVYRQRALQAFDQLQTIPEGVPISIWAAENAHEQTGLRFVLHKLKERNNAITIINTTNYYSELFNIRDVSYNIRHTGEICSDRLQLIYVKSKHDKPLSDHERAVLEQEWMTLASSRELLRISRDGKIESVSIDHYDPYIVHFAKQLQHEIGSEDFMPAIRLIGEALGHLEEYIGDDFLEYRVRTLVQQGVFEMTGKFEGMRFYSIRMTVNHLV